MTKADLVEQVADAIGPGVTKRDCALVVDGFINAVKQALVQGDSIEIRGFGTFSVREHKARTARNPKTGEPVKVPARPVPGFKPSKIFRDRIANGPPSKPTPAPLYSDPALSFPAPGPSRGSDSAGASDDSRTDSTSWPPGNFVGEFTV